MAWAMSQVSRRARVPGSWRERVASGAPLAGRSAKGAAARRPGGLEGETGPKLRRPGGRVRSQALAAGWASGGGRRGRDRREAPVEWGFLRRPAAGGGLLERPARTEVAAATASLKESSPPAWRAR